MELEAARDLAHNVLYLINPACQQTTVAGSIRRGKPEVKDIELVAEPYYDHSPPNLFGEAGAQTSRLEEKIAELVGSGQLAFDKQTKRNGPKYKRLCLPGHEMAIDLFIANAANWGNILAIRTGDADFSRALVTSRVFGGLMPTDMRQKDGMLWRGSQPVECFTEEDFFMHLGLFEIPPPSERDAAAARHLARRWAA